MLAFLIALLDHDIKDSEYRSALVSGLAVLGLDERCGWKSAKHYTPILSAITTVAKMLVLYAAKKVRDAKISGLVELESLAEEDAREQAPGHFDLVQDMADRFIGLTSHGCRLSPMDWVLRLRTYGQKIRYDTAEDGAVDWVGDRVLLGHTSFTMAHLRSMVHGLVHVARALLHAELLLLEVDQGEELTQSAREVLPEIQWDGLVDNPAELSAGWNLFKDARNSLKVDRQAWLYTRVLEEQGLRGAFVDSEATTAAGSQQSGRASGQVVWRVGRVEDYSRAKRKFEELALILCLLTGG